MHPRRGQIDRQLVTRVSYRELTGRFGVSKTALGRHLNNCIAPKVRHLQEKSDERYALDVIDQLKRINKDAVAILDAHRDEEPETALRAIAEIRKQIELQAKLLGDLDERPVVNVLLSSPYWMAPGTACPVPTSVPST